MRDYRVKRIESVSRAFEVLHLLQDMRGASLHDLHLATGIPKSTLLRILATAHEHGLVWQRMADSAFVPSGTTRPRVEVDDPEWLVEIASPVLERLAGRVLWPSILSIPRLDYLETVETNSTKAYFDEVPARPRGFRVNILRSASGRAYLANCPVQERETVLRRLRARGGPGDRLAEDPNAVRQLVETARRRGYASRHHDFGGDHDRPRSEVDDGRESIAVPIMYDGRVLGCMNLTWRRDVVPLAQMVRLHLHDLRVAVRAVEQGVAARLGMP